jgi:lipopolysaccharide/colanic/teichoic acid biosynthesis glycosyltransferase
MKRMNCDSVLLGSRTIELAGGLPFWKRALDFAIILLFSPIVILVAAAISGLVKLGSPGPILFRQRRVGYQGREFICFKFRTMKVNAETRSHQNHTAHLMKSDVPMTKLDAKKDPRLVPLGAALRATGLDELPQLINVLRGEMSLVGPRPCVLYEYELYEPWQRRRFDAVPGLTGLWQVSGKNRLSFPEMIELDIKYSQSLSLWLDLKIIAKTLPALWVQCMDTRAARKHAGEKPRSKDDAGETPALPGARNNAGETTALTGTRNKAGETALPVKAVRATVSRETAEAVTSVR